MAWFHLKEKVKLKESLEPNFDVSNRYSNAFINYNNMGTLQILVNVYHEFK